MSKASFILGALAGALFAGACALPGAAYEGAPEGKSEPRGPGDSLGCGDLDPVLGGELARALDRERLAARALGMNLGVRVGCATWIGASGAADLAGTVALEPADRFRIYSITKTFTAALVFRAVDRGQLSLDDPLATFYPDFPEADRIRIRHLLSHTSGIYDCLRDPAVVNDPHRPWDHEDLIQVAAGHGLSFSPGERFDYVNTNYFLLGRILEMVTETPYVDLLRLELLAPLGLDDTFLAGYEPIPGGFVEGARHSPFGALVDATYNWDDSLTWAAGGLVSTAQDQLDWFSALFSGAVVSPASLAQLTSPPVLTGGGSPPFGHGVAITPSAAGLYYSHNGGGAGIDLLAQTAFGFHAHLGLLTDHEIMVVVLANTGTSDVAAMRNAALVLAASSL